MSDYDDVEHLKNIGLVTSLAAPGQPQDVVSLLEYIRARMFDEIPERAGMNSVRIAEGLNYRKALPPMVSKAHLHALLSSPTRAERDVASSIARGKVKKVTIPGRSISASTSYEALVLLDDWIEALNSAQLGPPAEKYVHYLKGESSSPLFSLEERILLFKAGFLTSAASMSSSTNAYDSTTSTTLTSIASISKAASGSMAAVGGSGAFHGAGGGTGGLPTTPLSETDIRPSLPNTGAFLKLLNGATQHLLHLLSKSKYSEAPMSLLRERWNGGVATDGAARKTTGYSKDPFAEVLPGRTKKWKQFYGLRFEWVLAECLGAGLVEVFETGTVGKGVRAV